MTVDEREKLRGIIRQVTRNHVPATLLQNVEIEFEEDSHDEKAVFIVLHMYSGHTIREYADAMSTLSRALTEVTDTPDGFLFPYVSSLIEEEVA